MPDAPEAERGIGRAMSIGLLVVAAFCLAAAVYDALRPRTLGENVGLFLALAMASLVVHRVTKFKGMGIEFEQAVASLQKDVEQVSEAVVGLEKEVGPGSRSAAPGRAPRLGGREKAAAPPAETSEAAGSPADPNKGRFGGSPEANGRRLSATIEPAAGPKSAGCRVKVRVESTDPRRPLVRPVRLALHPTFGKWTSYEIQPRGGVARDEFVSYGAFTIGAETDDGATRLELDLMDVPGGTKRFYEE